MNEIEIEKQSFDIKRIYVIQMKKEDNKSTVKYQTEKITKFHNNHHGHPP